MAETLTPDELWRRIAPLLPPPRAGRPCRRPAPQRQALAGVVFVLRNGVPWLGVPAEMGCGHGRLCCRRLRDWRRAADWPGLRQALLGG